MVLPDLAGDLSLQRRAAINGERLGKRDCRLRPFQWWFWTVLLLALVLGTNTSSCSCPGYVTGVLPSTTVAQNVIISLTF